VRKVTDLLRFGDFFEIFTKGLGGENKLNKEPLRIFSCAAKVLDFLLF